MRTASVLIPRSTSHASNGPGHRAERLLQEAQPLAERVVVRARRSRRSRRSGRRGTSSSSGRRRRRRARAAAGGTASRRCCRPTRIAPTACAASAARRMSTTFSSGFDGVSTQTIAHVLVEVRRRGRSSNSLGRDVGEAVALRLVDLRGHAVDAAVDVGDQHDALAGVDEVHQRRRRAEPGRERDPVRRALEARERGLERGARGVPDARVVVALVDADRLLDVGRGLVDRRDRGARWPDRAPGRRGSRGSRTPCGDASGDVPNGGLARRSGRDNHDVRVEAEVVIYRERSDDDASARSRIFSSS